MRQAPRIPHLNMRRDPLRRRIEMAERVDQLALASARVALLRIYRHARFSHGKSPCKNWQGALRFPERSGEVAAPSSYIHLQPGASFVSADLWHPEPNAQLRIRHFILDIPASWEAGANAPKLRKRFGFGFGKENKLVRPPGGFPADLEVIEHFKHSNRVFLQPLQEETMTGPKLRELISAF